MLNVPPSTAVVRESSSPSSIKLIAVAVVASML
jgi:hypothetical protein